MRTALATAALLLAYSFDAAPQGIEIEPNEPCELAQEVGDISLPYSLTGALDALAPQGDVDFFSVRTAPGTGVEVRLEGFASNSGTLRDPFLGVFDSNCNLIGLNDDGVSQDSRVLTTVPDDGVLVLAATGCCDHTFQGEVGIGGSYALRLERALLVGSIRGRAVDATSLAPLPGDTFPYAHVGLYQCVGDSCTDWRSYTTADSEGEFEFVTDYRGERLLAGTYRIRVDASLYEQASTEPFSVGEGEDIAVGDISLEPVPRIGSVAGRVVDAINGMPLTGDSSPFARVWLWKCDDNDCFGFAAYGATDAEGRFRFEGASGGQAISEGTYRVEAEAEEYRRAASDPFSVGVDEDVVLGDLRLEPYPVGFSEVRPCADLPPEGGVCRFSLRVMNRLDRPVEGRVWSIVDGYGTGSLQDRTLFQAGFPRRMLLESGESKLATFRFSVPADLGDGATICGEVFFGLGKAGSRFDTAGRRRVFCIQKGVTGAFRLLTKRETYEIGSATR